MECGTQLGLNYSPLGISFWHNCQSPAVSYSVSTLSCTEAITGPVRMPWGSHFSFHDSLLIHLFVLLLFPALVHTSTTHPSLAGWTVLVCMGGKEMQMPLCAGPMDLSCRNTKRVSASGSLALAVPPKSVWHHTTNSVFNL